MALDEAVRWIGSAVVPVGVVASGSIVRGNPGPNSDLDIVVLHDRPTRRRVQRRFSATPVEIFFNSEAWLRHAISTEAAQGRPVMAHMLATGRLLSDTSGRMQALQVNARDVLDRGFASSADAILRDRYLAACQVEDVLDFGGIESSDARRLLALAVDALVRYAYVMRGLFLPRPKERQMLLSALDPVLAKLLAHALAAPFADASAALHDAALRLLGTSGFFEWDSGEDDAPPPV